MRAEFNRFNSFNTFKRFHLVYVWVSFGTK